MWDSWNTKWHWVLFSDSRYSTTDPFSTVSSPEISDRTDQPICHHNLDRLLVVYLRTRSWKTNVSIQFTSSNRRLQRARTKLAGIHSRATQFEFRRGQVTDYRRPRIPLSAQLPRFKMQKQQPSVNPRLKYRLFPYFHRLHVFLASPSDDEKFKMRHVSFEKPASNQHLTTDSVENKTPRI